MLPFNPILRITSYAVRFVVSHTRLPAIFQLLAPQLMLLLNDHIRRQGLLTTLTTFYGINRVIANRGSIAQVANLARANPIVTASVMNVLSGEWTKIISYKSIINKYFYLYTIGIVISSFPTITLKALKFTFGLLFASLGVCFSETLSSISILRDLSRYYLEFIQNNFDLKIFRSNNNYTTSEVLPFEDIVEEDKNRTLSLAAIIVLGIVFVTLSLVVADHYFPETIDKVAPINSYVDFVKMQTKNIYSYFMSFCPKGENAPDFGDEENIKRADFVKRFRANPEYTDPFEAKISTPDPAHLKNPTAHSPTISEMSDRTIKGKGK
uniref:Uncharacterized protein n=1 Tax=Coniophora puteana TaxID=80637 RepID=A0A896Z9R1_9AGAM